MFYKKEKILWQVDSQEDLEKHTNHQAEIRVLRSMITFEVSRNGMPHLITRNPMSVTRNKPLTMLMKIQ